MEDLGPIDWVERLGGWGLVTYIVIWGTRHANKTRAQVDAMIITFQKAVQSFQNLEKEEREVHEKIIRRLDDLHKRVAS